MLSLPTFHLDSISRLKLGKKQSEPDLRHIIAGGLKLETKLITKHEVANQALGDSVERAWEQGE
jgi:hypothetical protein